MGSDANDDAVVNMSYQVVVFLNRNYSYKTTATEIPLDAKLTSIP